MSAEAEERPWVPAATNYGRQSEKGKPLSVFNYILR